MKRTENPAKVFLRRYRGLCGRVDALQQAISQAMERAFNTGVAMREIVVMSSPAIADPMAENVCGAVDACAMLYEAKARADAALREILRAIDTLTDERQKEILTRRYVNGESFPEIMEKVGYEKTQVYVLHGRALMEINRWLERRGAE